jgi:hypothetical protein
MFACQYSGRKLPLFGISFEPVEDVPAKAMSYWNSWMVEVLGRVVRHTYLLHDSYRPHVRRGSEGHDLVKPDAGETICNSGACRLGGESSTAQSP